MKKLTESELQKQREHNEWVDNLIDDTLIDALFLENPYDDEPDEAEIMRLSDEVVAEYDGNPPQPLPELTEDEKTRTGDGVPFLEAFGEKYEEILFICRACGAGNKPGMWEFAGRQCPDCGSRAGAEKGPIEPSNAGHGEPGSKVPQQKPVGSRKGKS